MAYPPLLIAMLAGAEAGDDGETPFLVSGTVRSWLRPRRTEPLAVCFSFDGSAPSLDELLTVVEQAFRDAPKYSVTSALSRALLAAHTHLAHRNQLSLVEHRSYASATIATVRSNGVYVGRAGPSCVIALRGRQLMVRSSDLLGRSPPEAIPMGYPTPPHVATEFYPLEDGNGVLLLPGHAGTDATERSLVAALDGLPHLVLADALLERASPKTSAFAIWHPDDQTDVGDSSRWWVWTSARQLDAEALTDRRAPSADTIPVRNPEPIPTPVIPPSDSGILDRLRNGMARVRLPQRIPVLNNAGWLLPLLPLSIILAVAILLLRAGLPTPGGASQITADAGRIMQEAQANPDREVAAALLDDAIAMLEPQAGGSEGARALLADAHRSQDRVLDIVRVTRPSRANLPATPDFRPAGLWKTGDSLLILDLGGQLLYRTSYTGDQIEVTLRPGELLEGQPVGRLVTAAWSPPRGSNTEGQLIVVDHVRSMLSLNGHGSAQKRWWPPDNSGWQRLGPAAASYDDVFLLDTSREEVWRYPARLPGAAGTMVASTSDGLALGSVIDMATDGNLYLLQGTGEIAKQAPGAGRLPFDGAVPHRSLHAPVAIYAHPDLDHVWVLEPVEARVVEFTNQGTYVRQFAFPPEQIRNAVGLNVDGRSQELRVLTPQSIILVQME